MKVTSKGQATIPAEIRKALGIRPGDRIVWEIDAEGAVRIRRATPLDLEYLKAVESTLEEWHSEADEAAYHDL
ncbi:AbrB/MazE/SpoVT family DNA-binding domain-containing protein [Methylomarinovum caldicuralii]|uniref:AbrB/MazE/SpoVT family DNA-binding domain-containing protein n=1 Tax=Methylomarinovum caldicuralii TaxID=438856 RepID=UPI002955C3ED|nr:type II toxin-antitoxin system PrlF family antitoxin [Methylomarinovum caldicuralii]